MSCWASCRDAVILDRLDRGDSSTVVWCRCCQSVVSCPRFVAFFCTSHLSLCLCLFALTGLLPSAHYGVYWCIWFNELTLPYGKYDTRASLSYPVVQRSTAWFGASRLSMTETLCFKLPTSCLVITRSYFICESTMRSEDTLFLRPVHLILTRAVIVCPGRPAIV